MIVPCQFSWNQYVSNKAKLSVGSPGTNVFTDWYSETRDNHSILVYISIPSVLVHHRFQFPQCLISVYSKKPSSCDILEYHSLCQSPRSRFRLKAMVIRGCTSVWSFHSDPQSCSTCYCSVYESNYLIHSMNFQVLL